MPLTSDFYCTLAVTEALAVRVNVQVLALFPPLEQAPDQMASRPFETVSVIDVPVVKDADPVVPTATLIPAGVEVTLSPLRPVAVTVSVAVWAGAGAGVTVNTALRVAPPKEPLIVDEVDAVTAGVLTVNVALVAPAGTVTLAGTDAAVLLLESDTTAPPLGAALVKVAVPVAEPPPVTVDGLRVIALRLAGGGTGLTVSVAVRVVALCAPVIVTAVDVATELVVTAKVALVTLAATVTLGGTAATAAFELERFTRSPPPGAAAVSVTVPVEPFPPTTVAGFTDTDDNDAVVTAACGVKRCVAENGPKTPAELLARTRHQRRLAGRAPIVACEAVTVALATNGAAIVEVSSIWIS